MEAWAIISAVYTLVSIAAIIMTYREQERRNQKSQLFSFSGYLLCTIWPVTVVAILVVMGRRALIGKLSSYQRVNSH